MRPAGVAWIRSKPSPRRRAAVRSIASSGPIQWSGSASVVAEGADRRAGCRTGARTHLDVALKLWAETRPQNHAGSEVMDFHGYMKLPKAAIYSTSLLT